MLANFAHDCVHRIKICDIREINRELHDILKLRTRGLENGLDISEHLSYFVDKGTGVKFHSFGVERDLTGEIDRILYSDCLRIRSDCLRGICAVDRVCCHELSSPSGRVTFWT